jgi:DNA-binding MltR family transcriptional regulator
MLNKSNKKPTNKNFEDETFLNKIKIKINDQFINYKYIDKMIIWYMG